MRDNKDKKIGRGLWAALVGVAVVVIARWMPHPPNVTPLVGLTIFGSAFLMKRAWNLILPILALWVSDLFLNNVVYSAYFEGWVWIHDTFIWSALALITIALISRTLFKKRTPGKVIGISLSASVVFYLISNFGVWVAAESIYPKNLSGLMASYVAGLPFLRNGMLGDLFYCMVFFGGYAWLQSRWTSKEALETA